MEHEGRTDAAGQADESAMPEDALPAEATPDGTAQPPDGGAPTPPKNMKEQLYDKIPLTFRQADILVKVLLALFVVMLIIAVLTGGLFR